MKKFVLVLGCAAVLVFQSPAALSQEQKAIKHGGKIETKYDGFSHETLMRLKKMKVNCDGFKDKFKDACVSIEVTLHCPGTQLNYVKEVTIQIVFENQDWVYFHPPDQRDLSVVTDTETLRLGRMAPAVKRTGSWDTKAETLELIIPYQMFKKMALSETLEIQVGRDAVALRKNNVAALKDLNSRVIPPRATESAASPK